MTQTDEDMRKTQVIVDHQPYRIRLPGFIGDEPIGLGDVIKRTTAYFGVKPCGGCQQRANALNSWMVITK